MLRTVIEYGACLENRDSHGRGLEEVAERMKKDEFVLVS
jgi:hypothetical protein